MCLGKDIISAYCDGETEGRVKSLIESHLNECEACRKTAESYRSLSQSLQRTAEEPSSADLIALANRIRALQPAENRHRRYLPKSVPVPAFKLALFLFLILFAFTFILFSVIIFNGGNRNGQAVMASVPTETAVPEIPDKEPVPNPMFRPTDRNLRTVDY